MEIYKVVGIGIISIILILILKENKREDIAVMINIIASIMIVFLVLSKLEEIISLIYSLINKTGVSMKYLEILLKITGITYIISIGSAICKDANQNAIAEKIEIAGKIYIVSYSIPLITEVLSVIGNLI